MAGLIDSLRGVVRTVLGLPLDPGEPPDLMRLGRYRCTVVAQHADKTLDLQPEDKRISPESNVVMRLPVPAMEVTVQPGAVVMLGWERGDPGRPYATPEWESGATVVLISIGSSPDPVVTQTDLAVFLKAWQDATVVAQDGGASMRQATITALTLPPPAGPGWTVAGALGTQCGSRALKVQR